MGTRRDDEEMRSSRVRGQPTSGGESLRRRGAAGLDQQPAASLGQIRYRSRSLVLAYHFHQARIDSLDSLGRVSEQDRDRVRGGGHVGIAENDERRRPGRRYKADDRAQHQHAGSLGADERFGEISAVLRQQML